MEKEAVIAQIKIAKNAHIDWVYKAKSLIDSKGAKENFAPVSSQDCVFGQWFYTEGQKLGTLSNNPLECMKNITQLHQSIHDIYLSIFTKYSPQEVKKPLFSKLFSEKKRVLDSDDLAFVESEFKKLELLSSELLDELSRLERRIVAVSDEKIVALG